MSFSGQPKLSGFGSGFGAPGLSGFGSPGLGASSTSGNDRLTCDKNPFRYASSSTTDNKHGTTPPSKGGDKDSNKKPPLSAGPGGERLHRTYSKYMDAVRGMSNTPTLPRPPATGSNSYEIPPTRTARGASTTTRGGRGAHAATRPASTSAIAPNATQPKFSGIGDFGSAGNRFVSARLGASPTFGSYTATSSNKPDFASSSGADSHDNNFTINGDKSTEQKKKLFSGRGGSSRRTFIDAVRGMSKTPTMSRPPATGSNSYEVPSTRTSRAPPSTTRNGRDPHIKDTPKPDFEYDGFNVIYTHKISLRDALTEAQIDVPTPDGTKYSLFVDRIISPKTTATFFGQGLRKGDQRGDLIVKFDISFPDSLSPNDKEFIKNQFPST